MTRAGLLAVLLAGCGSIPVVFPGDAGTRACSEAQPCARPLVCDALGECVECISDAQCSGALPACDPATKRCVACRGTVGCSSPQVCSASAPVCVQTCQEGSPSACPGFLGGCHSGVCAQCTDDDDCGTGRHCETAIGRCVNCTVDAHCGGATPRCDVAAGLCRACVVNADCEPTKSCFQGTCR